MMDLPVLYLITKLMAVVASCMLMGNAKVDMIKIVISVLSFACIFVLELLIDRLWKKRSLLLFTISASIIACFYIQIELIFPLLLILILHLLELLLSSEMFYQISIVALILLFFIFPPVNLNIMLLSITLVIMVIFSRLAIIKLEGYIHKNETLRERIVKLESKIVDLNGLMKTLKTTASLEERNRIAARIHDEIGHGISGSIILLEAAMLQMNENHKKAAVSVEKAILNLRESVDEIRTALREERTDKSLLGIHDITAILEEFKVRYNISSKLKTTGDLKNISIDMWACIHDNLKECLTNVLKHSNATEFVLSIQVFNKIIKVEYKDNGKTDQEYEKHLGLDAIEERTVNCKGRCFFSKDENGFCVTNIFTVN
ncbi:MAG: histidine kinase [Herbinix sp.]|nr:histidine kinase [Herbinix sp.]